MSKNNSNIKVFDKLVSKTKIYLVIIGILLAVICFYENRFILPAILIFVLILMYAFWTNNKRRNEISEHIKDLTLTVDNAAKSTLINSPFPLIVIETDGNIVWKSSKFIKEFASTDIGAHLNLFVKELKLELANSSEENKKELKELIKKQIVIGEKTYNVFGEYVKSKNDKEYMATLYFIDDTENVQMLKKYNNSKVCIGMVMIDNYEEIMQRVSAEDRPIFIAAIEKTLYEWAAEYNGLLVKSDRDTFVAVLEKENLLKLQEEKFTILDKIKEVSIPGKIQATLSIAFSDEEEDNYKKYKSAQTAIDIALGRGGDQAIVRKNGKYVFFGGRAQEVEKRTKVRARIVAQALQELVLQSDKVIIMGHTNSDIDAMGSGFGIYRFAKTLGKDAYIVNETSSFSIDNFISIAKEDEEYNGAIIDKNTALQIITQDSLLVVVDTHKTTYVEAPELLSKTNKIVIIDHHRRSPDFIQKSILTFHEVYASSAAELVTELLQYTNTQVDLSKIEAEVLYAGIMMDTKNFTFKTGVRTFEAAAYLRKCGVDIIRVKKWFQSDLETYKKITNIIDKTTLNI